MNQSSYTLYSLVVMNQTAYFASCDNGTIQSTQQTAVLYFRFEILSLTRSGTSTTAPTCRQPASSRSDEKYEILPTWNILGAAR